MSGWKPGGFAKKNAQKSSEKVAKEAVEGLNKLASTFQKLLASGHQGNRGCGKGGKNNLNSNAASKGGGKGQSTAPDGSWHDWTANGERASTTCHGEISAAAASSRRAMR